MSWSEDNVHDAVQTCDHTVVDKRRRENINENDLCLSLSSKLKQLMTSSLKTGPQHPPT